MIGLIAAEKSETGNLVKTIQAKIIEFNGVRYYIGNIKGQQVVACFCGIGKANAAMTATNMIINFGVDKIFNIGLCGSCKTSIAPGTIIIADSLQYSDIDLTAFNYQLNQLPEEPLRFDVKKEYINYLKSIIDSYSIGTIATADSVVSLNNIEMFPALVDKDIIGFDMEATAIAQVCKHANVDFLCVKLVSDNITFDKNSKGQYDTNYKPLAKKIEGICLKVLEYYSK